MLKKASLVSFGIWIITRKKIGELWPCIKNLNQYEWPKCRLIMNVDKLFNLNLINKQVKILILKDKIQFILFV
jgi:hypothetical protein